MSRRRALTIRPGVTTAGDDDDDDTCRERESERRNSKPTEENRGACSHAHRRRTRLSKTVRRARACPCALGGHDRCRRISRADDDDEGVTSAACLSAHTTTTQTPTLTLHTLHNPMRHEQRRHEAGSDENMCARERNYAAHTLCA